MAHRILVGQRLLALFMLGWLLFNYPLLALFDGATDWLGLPAVWVYLFVAWGVLIVLMACVAEQTWNGQSHAAWPGRADEASAASVPDASARE